MKTVVWGIVWAFMGVGGLGRSALAFSPNGSKSGTLFSQQAQKRSHSSASKSLPASSLFSAGTFEEIEGKILVRVQLNGALDTKLLLDSTIPTSLLSSEAAQTLHLKLPSAGVKDKLAKLALGKAILKGVEVTLDDGSIVTAWNQAHPAAVISGALGLNLLEHNALGFDFATHTYGLWLGGKIRRADAENFNRVVCTPRSDACAALSPGSILHADAITLTNPPMHHIQPQTVALERAEGEDRYHVRVAFNGVPVPCYLDMGATGFHVIASLAPHLHALPYTASTNAKQPRTPDSLYVRACTLGSFETTVNWVQVVDRPQEDPVDTRMGINSSIFANCRVVLDFPGHTLYLSPNDLFVENMATRKRLAPLYDRGLLLSSPESDHSKTLQIGKDSPAEKAGLQDGDELLEVGGQSLEALAGLPDRGAHLLEQTPFQVTVRRRGQFEKRVFTLFEDHTVSINFTGYPPPFSRDRVYATFFDTLHDRAEIERVQRALHAELTKYPTALLEKNLKEIYVVRSLTAEDIGIGGINSPAASRLYVLDEGMSGVGSDEFVRLTLHHELAHLLMAKNDSFFSRTNWENSNESTVNYGTGGLEFIRAGHNSTPDLDPVWMERGFVNRYGTASIDEDFASFAEALFSGDPRFWQAVDRFPVLNKKMKMIIAFYHSLDKTLTESYFRQLAPLADGSEASARYPISGMSALGPRGSVAHRLLMALLCTGSLLLVFSLVFFRLRSVRQGRKSPGVSSSWLYSHTWHAVMNDHVARAENFLSRGADVNSCDENGNPLLVRAISEGHLETAQVLLRFHPNVNAAARQTKLTPLMGACKRGAKEIVETLLAAGANIEAQSQEGASALHYAAIGGYAEIVAMLLQRGANSNRKDRNGNTAQMAAQRQLEETTDPTRKAELLRVLEELQK